MRSFHGRRGKYPYFEGWYLKHQYAGGMIAFIPAFHADMTGKWTASIQVITEKGTWCFAYPMEVCSIKKGRFQVKIGDNIFTEKGCVIKLESEEMTISGHLLYGSFLRIRGDIMGPFRYLPFMECRHSVLSMGHSVRGHLKINGQMRSMSGHGYVEGDRGHSFPEHYLWTQSFLDSRGKDSIMLSIADIPMWGVHFCGCICSIYFEGQEYRMATYRGGRIKKYRNGEAILKQGIYQLRVSKLSDNEFELQAPTGGVMSRVIKEHPSCAVRYQFWKGKNKVFDIMCSRASFEQA